MVNDGDKYSQSIYRPHAARGAFFFCLNALHAIKEREKTRLNFIELNFIPVKSCPIEDQS